MQDPLYGHTSFPSLGPYLFSGQFLRGRFQRVFQGGLNRQDTITATAGGTKAAAYALTKSLNHVTVCATGNDSVLLPAAIAGSMVVVTNSGAQTLAIYGKGTDTIDGAATANAKTLATTKTMILVCFTRGAWFSMTGA